MANANIADRRRSPLADRAHELAEARIHGDRSVAVREIPFTTQIGVRAHPSGPAHQAIASQLPAGLPARVGEVAGEASATAALWLGPDEFLVVAPDGTELAEPLLQALAGHPGQVVDLSANRTIIEISGAASRWVLRKSCPLDLDSSVWQPGQAYSTTVGHVPVLLWRIGQDTWWILPRASFASHVANWLLDGMQEFSAPELK